MLPKATNSVKKAYFFCVNLRGSTFEVADITMYNATGFLTDVEIKLYSRNDTIDPQDVLGNTATLHIAEEQYFLPYAGIVTEFRQVEHTEGITLYNARLTVRDMMMCA